MLSVIFFYSASGKSCLLLEVDLLYLFLPTSNFQRLAIETIKSSYDEAGSDEEGDLDSDLAIVNAHFLLLW